MSVGIAARLAAEAERYMGTLERLGVKLTASMDTDVVLREDGVKVTTPSRDWCRAFGRYQLGLTELLAEERERTKLRLLVDKDANHRVLTDEEYEAELRTLGIEAVRTLSGEELAREAERRGLSLEHVRDDREDDT